MSDKTLNLNPELYEYLQHISLREPDILKKLRAKTQKMEGARMQISAEQGQLMGFLVRLMQAKKTLEVGTFTGYSALAVALALPPDGYVITCDIDTRATSIAQEFWDAAGVANKIQLKIAPALETLDQLIAAGESHTFDFVFIDADKMNYINYYEKCLELVRSGGLIVVDNVLWGGKVADAQIQDKTTKAIRAFNEHLLHDDRILLSTIPIGDGLTLVCKN